MEVMNERDQLTELRHKMVEQVQDYAIILLDVTGKVLSWNKGVERIKGYKEHEIVGQNFNIFYMPLDRQYKLPENLLDLAKKEGSAKHIGRRVRKDGAIYWGSVVITALHDDQNNVIGFTKLTRELRDGDTE
jgi:PAS domain S-box-containing protein